MPRAWRWLGINQASNKTLATAIDKEGKFNFYLHIYTPSGVTLLSLYGEHNWDILLSWRDNLEPFAMIMAAVVASGMLLFKLEFDEGAVLYSP